MAVTMYLGFQTAKLGRGGRDAVHVIRIVRLNSLPSVASLAEPVGLYVMAEGQRPRRVTEEFVRELAQTLPVTEGILDPLVGAEYLRALIAVQGVTPC